MPAAAYPREDRPWPRAGRSAGATAGHEEGSRALRVASRRARRVKKRLPAAAQVGPGAARLGGGLAAVLALLQRPLDHAEDEDHEREEADQDEARVGHHEVIGRPVRALAAVVRQGG